MPTLPTIRSHTSRFNEFDYDFVTGEIPSGATIGDVIVSLIFATTEGAGDEIDWELVPGHPFVTHLYGDSDVPRARAASEDLKTKAYIFVGRIDYSTLDGGDFLSIKSLDSAGDPVEVDGVHHMIAIQDCPPNVTVEAVLEMLATPGLSAATPPVSLPIKGFTISAIAARHSESISAAFDVPTEYVDTSQVIEAHGSGVIFVAAAANQEEYPGQSIPRVITLTTASLGLDLGAVFSISVSSALADMCVVKARVMGTDGMPKAGVVLSVKPLRTGSAEVGDVLVEKADVSATSNVAGYVEAAVIRSDEYELHDGGDSANYDISIPSLLIEEADVELSVAEYDLGVVLP